MVQVPTSQVHLIELTRDLGNFAARRSPTAMFQLIYSLAKKQKNRSEDTYAGRLCYHEYSYDESR